MAREVRGLCVGRTGKNDRVGAPQVCLAYARPGRTQCQVHDTAYESAVDQRAWLVRLNATYSPRERE